MLIALILSASPALLPTDAPPLVDAVTLQVPEAPAGRMGWTIAGPIVGGFGGALAGGRIAAELARGSGNMPSFIATYAGIAGGALIGAFSGWFAGKLARQGSTAAKIASILLYVAAGSMFVGEVVEIRNAIANCHMNLNFGIPIY